MLEKLQNLTDEQKTELSALTTVEEVSAFAEKHNIDLTSEETAEIAANLPDDALDEVAGGRVASPPQSGLRCDNCRSATVDRSTMRCTKCGNFGVRL